MKRAIVFVGMKAVGFENSIIHEQDVGTDMIGWDKKTGIESFSLVGVPSGPGSRCKKDEKCRCQLRRSNESLKGV